VLNPMEYECKINKNIIMNAGLCLTTIIGNKYKIIDRKEICKDEI
jgi:hypothetical protein